MLFTSACRSLAAILNNWQPAQEAAISRVDDLFYFPSLREQQKHQSWVDMERPEPGAEMREAAFLPFLVNLPLCFAFKFLTYEVPSLMGMLLIPLCGPFSWNKPLPSFLPLKSLGLESMSPHLGLNFRSISFQAPYITNSFCFLKDERTNLLTNFSLSSYLLWHRLLTPYRRTHLHNSDSWGSHMLPS